MKLWCTGSAEHQLLAYLTVFRKYRSTLFDVLKHTDRSQKGLVFRVRQDYRAKRQITAPNTAAKAMLDVSAKRTAVDDLEIVACEPYA